MARNKKGRPVSGWLVLDKPYELGSTQAVGKIRWLFQAKKAGHAGTLDPLATGLLPIALGEATKTVPYVTDGQKTYRFTVRFGEETNTDDAEGEIVNSADQRPADDEIIALLPKFIGNIQQVPPAFSAIKIDGKRAYAEARAGKEVVLQSREVVIESLEMLTRKDADHAEFELTCGKGTYIRAIARDMGRELGCYGHVVELRRTYVEPFEEALAITLPELEALEGNLEALDEYLISPMQAMDGFPEIRVAEDEARRIRLGNAIILRGRDAPIEEQDVCAVYKGSLVAIGDVRRGEFQPKRVLAAD